ncbi:F-box protein At-B [Dioscorea cayenensis subsp. rotundata]|uniref:F-box protein At-B n=1 Tax=Dioscorea cayennensis subsp. rotundata TaxID=55577 RepID=A0AB40CY74_DIOCR|nr:F-box protein At-B [Dioscorea cayenensis subsp. rotundata]
MANRAREGGAGELIERLPKDAILEILRRLDLLSLCSVAPVSRSLRLLVSQSLSCITTLDLSGFSLSTTILKRVLGDNKVLRSLTLDCTQLEDSSIEVFAKEHLEEIVLLKCLMFSSYIFIAIGMKCHNLRRLTLEMLALDECESLDTCNKDFSQMLRRCSCLEFLWVKLPNHCPHLIDDEYWESIGYEDFESPFPKRIKGLVLQPLLEHQAELLSMMIGQSTSSINVGMGVGLQSLTLVLNLITDDLLVCITGNLRHLVELCLEDRPVYQPSPPNDLTGLGLLALSSCKGLACLTLIRSKIYCPATFKSVKDVDMQLLAEGCSRFESIKLGGFSKVTDAGYVSILHSCRNLRKLEIINSLTLSDLTFHNLADIPCPLREVRLVACNALTCDAARSLSSCRDLEVLDLSGCRSIADAGLESIAKLCKLSKLDLSGADITDDGIGLLGNGTSPIAYLYIRGCKRITDTGIAMLLTGNGIIKKTLKTLDISYLPEISDRSISIVEEHCSEITDLSIRYCPSLTDNSIKVLGSIERRRSLRRLDVCNCQGFSSDSLRLFSPPYFRGLRWLGVANSKLFSSSKNKREDMLSELTRERPLLRVCQIGCELGCRDRWQYHEKVQNMMHLLN